MVVCLTTMHEALHSIPGTGGGGRSSQELTKTSLTLKGTMFTTLMSFFHYLNKVKQKEQYEVANVAP